ncbi:MAG: prepilin-type N-terminal cleavage/methylation domain-containing protein [Candidatus Saccharimonas sp.]
MTKTKFNQKGFTIVELLIVIVVIAILAAISIVAYNGIQNRANASSNKESASQVKNKIEAWNTIKGAYPTLTQLVGGLSATDAKEAALDATLVSKLAYAGTSTAPTGSASATKDKPVGVSCVSTTGYTITWWAGDKDSASLTPAEKFTVGTC